MRSSRLNHRLAARQPATAVNVLLDTSARVNGKGLILESLVSIMSAWQP